MKNFKPALLLCILLIMKMTVVFGQNSDLDSLPKNRVFFEGQIGLSHLLANNIDEDMHNALNAGFRIRFELAKRKLSIAPSFNIKQFTRQEGYSDSQEYLLTLSKVGLQLNYMLYESKDRNLQMFNFCELNYSFSSYDFRYEDDSFRPTGVSNYELFEIFKGKGPGVMLGYRLKYHFVFVELGYDIYGSTHTLSQEAINQFDQADIAYEKEMDFGINTFSVNFGFSVPITKQSFNRHFLLL